MDGETNMVVTTAPALTVSLYVSIGLVCLAFGFLFGILAASIALHRKRIELEQREAAPLIGWTAEIAPKAKPATPEQPAPGARVKAKVEGMRKRASAAFTWASTASAAWVQVQTEQRERRRDRDHTGDLPLADILARLERERPRQLANPKRSTRHDPATPHAGRAERRAVAEHADSAVG